MKTINVFISQPMRGLSEKSIVNNRLHAIDEIYDRFGGSVKIIDSLFEDSDDKPLELLGKSISLLADADIAYFCKGWEDARGCRIEHQVCLDYGIECVTEK